MILQSKDEFDRVVEMQSPGGGRRELSKSGNPELEKGPTAGGYGAVDGHFLAMYVHNDRLYVQLDSQTIVVSSDVTAEQDRLEGRNMFRILRDGAPVMEFSYSPPSIDPPLDTDPTPFIEYEDYDFPFFVYRVLTDPKRRSAFREAHTK